MVEANGIFFFSEVPMKVFFLNGYALPLTSERLRGFLVLGRFRDSLPLR